jgi:hypothetical protein
MRPLQYHHGQLEVQDEANTRELAGRLAHWVGPAAEFAERADMLVFAALGDDDRLHFAAMSGPAPLLRADGSSTLRLKASGLVPSGPVGGLAINLGEARRVRLNGTLRSEAEGDLLEVDEAFTLCRKYLVPSLRVGESQHIGPAAGEPVDLGDSWLRDVVARAETTFLASVTPDGLPDVAHRGGPPGFLELDAEARRLAWPEYLGDGVFKSAGNVRATSRLTLLVLDLDTGDAAELIGRGTYTNLRPMRRPRGEALVRDRQAFPEQGRMVVELEEAVRLPGLIAPRRRIERALKVTSQSSAAEQAPQ